MNCVRTPQSRCRAAAARCDITPPIGIYHRMWGAAMHDQATGVHRPLLATLLWLSPDNAGSGEPQIMISLDHCILDGSELDRVRAAISAAVDVGVDNVVVTLTHTHGSGWMSRTRSHLPGGELIGPYLDELPGKLAELALQAREKLSPATIVYAAGQCNLAAHRDYFDARENRFVCGFNPAGPADDMLLVARIISDAGENLATVVNYACHPTTLAWDNTLLSSDWVGAMQETVEQATGGLCLFLQGASGDLGPREGFVGDTAVADRNGRQVGYAALSTLATVPPVATEYRYAGAVTSGTAIGVWRHEPQQRDAYQRQAIWQWETLVVELPYRHDLPTVEQTQAEREHWQAEEALAGVALDEPRWRDCRAQVEQRTRQLARLNVLPAGRAFPLSLRLGRLGDAFWLFVPGELYQVFQTTLRSRCAPRLLVVATLCNDWQPGYIPPAAAYGYGIYQETIAATAAGSLEMLIEAVWRQLESM